MRGVVLRHTPKKSEQHHVTTPPESREAAAAAGLRYVTYKTPGFRRVRVGKGFRYVTPDGATARDARELERIRSLVIPPAWTNVWICADARGHLQATGRDARGRKQHRYHPRWRHVRDEAKYQHISRVRLGVASTTQTRRRRSGRAGADPTQGRVGRRAAPREDADSRRQRRVRAQQPVVRPDDAAQRARAGVRFDDSISIPRQVRQVPRHRPQRRTAREDRSPMSGSAGPGALPIPG